MDVGALFGAWAVAFEKAYAEDDWDPLERHLAADATYRILAGPPFGGTWRGRAGFVEGLRHSVETLDRRFEERHVALEGAPAIGDDTFRMSWRARYVKQGAPDFELRGRETVQFADGRIVEMTDEMEEGAAERFASYREAHLD